MAEFFSARTKEYQESLLSTPALSQPVLIRRQSSTHIQSQKSSFRPPSIQLSPSTSDSDTADPLNRSGNYEGETPSSESEVSTGSNNSPAPSPRGTGVLRLSPRGSSGFWSQNSAANQDKVAMVITTDRTRTGSAPK